jgi:hypothetical protein
MVFLVIVESTWSHNRYLQNFSTKPPDRIAILEQSIAELDKQIEEVTGFKEFFTPKGPTQQELNKLNPFLAEAVWRYHDASVYLPEGVTIGYLPLRYAWIVVGPKGSVKVEEHVGWWSNLERVKQAVKKVM